MRKLRADEIDESRAREAKIRAERRMSGDKSGIDLQRAEIALKKSLIRISLKKLRINTSRMAII